MFEGIVMEDDIKKNLIWYVEAGCPFNLILQGEAHVGKRTIAEVISKEYLGVESLETVSDFIRVEPENDMISLDKIREIKEKIRVMPVLRKKKVILIDQADRMGIAAQNALLKVLEDGTEHNVFLLISSNNMIPTVTSRCKVITVLADTSLQMPVDIHNRMVRGRHGVKCLYEESDFFAEMSEFENLIVCCGEKRELLEFLGCIKEKDRTFFYERFSKEENIMFLEYLESLFLDAVLHPGTEIPAVQKIRNWYGQDRIFDLFKMIGKQKKLLEEKKSSKNDMLNLLFEMVI